MKTRTVGISPKLVAAVVTAVLTYVLGQEVLELPAGAVVAGQAILVALAAYVASAGDVVLTTPEDGGREGLAGERGVTEPLTLLVYVIVIVILIVVLFEVLDRV
jgi:hypothetical protein